MNSEVQEATAYIFDKRGAFFGAINLRYSPFMLQQHREEGLLSAFKQYCGGIRTGAIPTKGICVVPCPPDNGTPLLTSYVRSQDV